jgi:hypothetical protein
VLFVHGWNGDAASDGTWDGFQDQIAHRGTFSEVDALFWDYKSLDQTLAYSAAQFSSFLETLITDPGPQIIDPSLRALEVDGRGKDFRYNKLILCGHSLGAVVARRAMLDIERDGENFLRSLEIRAIYFAPAHHGSPLPELGRHLQSVGGMIGWTLGTAVKVAEKLLRSHEDLKERSPYLLKLEQETVAEVAKLKAAGNAFTHLTAKTLHAQNDKVVIQDNYIVDRRFETVDGEDHRSICKPRDGYLKPIQEIQKFL